MDMLEKPPENKFLACIPSCTGLNLSQMFSAVDTKDPTAVEVQVQAAYLSMFRQGDRLFVPRVFGWIIECFTGHYAEYQAIDARYHDLEHTLQGTLCLSRLLWARAEVGAEPSIDQREFELGLVAILFHDTGYLKTRGDTEGTGAKYTLTHVARSAEFAGRFLAEKEFSPREIRAVQNMIQCTGVNANLAALPFQTEPERLVGFALATADLLGQMAADDYPDKLPILYGEFAEAERYSNEQNPVISGFKSARDLMCHTPIFWETFVQPKLKREFCGLYQFLSRPYPSGPNYYLQRIEANLERVKRKVSLPELQGS
jgi:hypothetical protein